MDISRYAPADVDMLPASVKVPRASSDMVSGAVRRAPPEPPAVEATVEPRELDAEHLNLWIRALGAFVPLEFG